MAHTNNYTLGRGKLYFSPFRPGTTNPAGFRYIGNTPSLSYTATVEKLDHYNSDAGIRVKDASVVLSADFAMQFTTDDISAENVAMFFLNENPETITQASATGQTETITVGALERRYALGVSDATPTGLQNVSGVTVSNGATALEAEVDYQVDLATGTVKFLEGGAVSVGDTLTVSYGVEAATYERVISGSSAVRGALRFVSDNPKGDNFTIYAPCVEITPNGDYELKGDDWQTLSFSVSVEKLAERAAIYRDGHALRA
ncbi:hypothetical protein [Paracoccus sanguinis]|uniref:Uncharacterized protein n=1 Tax=Paracoccus sanguinis TaxID=1545044 RepID=A0A099GLZ0_9RHOB|nr:hypothetical protein [Paracoccus sanguinis]KGJ23761.1 hypothetical protein IX56_00350 [Paracoccus sanguinis]